MRRPPWARGVLAAALAFAWPHATADAFAFSGELRAVAEPQSANPRSPLVEAAAIAPGLVAPQRGSATLSAELRARGHDLNANLLLQQVRSPGGESHGHVRINELYASRALPFGSGWQGSAGKKIVAWDVGYGWRPNDVVEQEARRLLIAQTPEGRPLLQLDRFDADTAWTVVWVNPTRQGSPPAQERGARESALAARVYRHAGAADWHGFLRIGQHSRASVGAALARVATNSLELHASARLAQRHDGWALDASAGGQPVAVNPWSLTTQGGASQWLLGLNWTGAQQLGLLAEIWHDGTALSDDGWDRWTQRNRALPAAAAPREAVAGNLAWQAAPWTAANLRRDNLFLRMSWQHDAWQPAVDLLFTPADRGRTATASLAWQGDRWRLEGGLRQYGGPDKAVLAQLPLRRSGYLAATRAF
jgi:hypothetical protein